MVKGLTRWILIGQTPFEVDTREWAAWFETHHADRIIAQEDIPGHGWLSTVFLSLNHNWFETGLPVLFETMLFPNKDDLREMGQWRWRSYLEAQRGHEEIRDALLSGRPTPESPA